MSPEGRDIQPRLFDGEMPELSLTYTPRRRGAHHQTDTSLHPPRRAGLPSLLRTSSLKIQHKMCAGAKIRTGTPYYIFMLLLSYTFYVYM